MSILVYSAENYFLTGPIFCLSAPFIPCMLKENYKKFTDCSLLYQFPWHTQVSNKLVTWETREEIP
jgi:hypothetical protein